MGATRLLLLLPLLPIFHAAASQCFTANCAQCNFDHVSCLSCNTGYTNENIAYCRSGCGLPSYANNASFNGCASVIQLNNNPGASFTSSSLLCMERGKGEIVWSMADSYCYRCRCIDNDATRTLIKFSCCCTLSCEFVCVLSFSTGLCTSCCAGFTLVGFTCVRPCSPQCVSCLPGGICLACFSGYTVSEGVCVAPACPDACASCGNSAPACITCHRGYVNAAGVCYYVGGNAGSPPVANLTVAVAATPRNPSGRGRRRRTFQMKASSSRAVSNSRASTKTTIMMMTVVTAASWVAAATTAIYFICVKGPAARQTRTAAAASYALLFVATVCGVGGLVVGFLSWDTAVQVVIPVVGCASAAAMLSLASVVLVRACCGRCCLCCGRQVPPRGGGSSSSSVILDGAALGVPAKSPSSSSVGQEQLGQQEPQDVLVLLSQQATSGV